MRVDFILISSAFPHQPHIFIYTLCMLEAYLLKTYYTHAPASELERQISKAASPPISLSFSLRAISLSFSLRAPRAPRGLCSPPARFVLRQCGAESRSHETPAGLRLSARVHGCWNETLLPFRFTFISSVASASTEEAAQRRCLPPINTQLRVPQRDSFVAC